MSYYANAKGGIPFHKREEERRWKEHLKHHKRALDRKKRSSISNLEPRIEHQHVQIKLKKLQLQEDRLSTIEYENRRLREKLDNIDSRREKLTWNKHYTPREKSDKLPTLYVAESSLDENYYTSSYADESSAEEELAGDDSEKDAADEAATTDALTDEMDSVRTDDNEEDMSARSSKNSSSSRNSNEDVVVQENHNIKKRLKHLEYTLDQNPENEEIRRQRKKNIEKARQALKRENELFKQRNGYQRRFVPIGNEERVMENRRLHKKICEIKKGKGRPETDDPVSNTHDRWWVTSPRGQERAAYEKEKERLLKEMKKRRERRKNEKAREDRKIMKKLEQEEKQQKEEIPKGLRKKKRKKAKPIENESEELPDTSIIRDDPYNRLEIEDAEQDE